MIRFKSISIKNFLSYGNIPTVIQLDRAGTTMILGENLDDTTNGITSSGVGKTTLVNALAYAVYDKPVSNISKDNLVNNINKKNMEVTVEFEQNGKTYHVTRTRKTKSGAAGNSVQLFVDGKDITPDSVANTNIEIQKIVRIPYDLFVRIVTFSTSLTPFFDLPVRAASGPNQTDIIEELFDLKTLSEKANLLKEKIKDVERSLEIHKTRNDQLQREYDRHETQVESAKRRIDNWDVQREQEIIRIRTKLERLAGIDVESQRQFHLELAEVNTELKDAKVSQKDIERQLTTFTKEVKEKTKELEQLQDAKCPYCKQDFHGAAAKIKECQTVIKVATKEVDSLSKSLIEADQLVEDLTTKRDTIKSQITVTDVDELLEIKSKASHYEKKIEELLIATNPFVEPLKELEDTELDPLDMSTINDLTTLIEHQKFLLKLLTKKDSFVRKTLLNKSIPFLNQRLAHYLSFLGLPHTVEFTHEMTAGISQFGRPLDFGNLSNGQQARVNIALSLAFRDVLQSLHEKINVCMFDEVLDVGLDGVGVQAAAKMLKKKARDDGLSLFIISHRNEIDSTFDRKMIVQMSGGFSSIRYEDG